MSGAPYKGGHRQSPRVARHSYIIADMDFDDDPQRAPYGAFPWVTPPVEVDIGYFGVDALGRLNAADDLVYMPVVGNRKFISAAATLVAADAGSICSLNVASGVLYTLPPPSPGMFFEFHWDATITSGAGKIITDAATTFMLGWFKQSTDGTFVQAVHAANGTTHRSMSTNGTTTGGYIGDVFYALAISATQWRVWGTGAATGAEATPFATS